MARTNDAHHLRHGRAPADRSAHTPAGEAGAGRPPGQGTDAARGAGVAATNGKTPGALRRTLHAFLGVRLFYKILVANAGIVVAGAIAGTAVTARHVRAAPDGALIELVGLLALASVIVSVLVNALILIVALKPVRTLEAAAARIHGGDLAARAPLSPLADRDLRRLIRTFNGMLDRLALYRSRLRGMAQRILQVAEEDRRRIAKDLHDDTAETLAALLLRVRLAQSEEDPALRDAILGEIRQAIAEAMERVRFSAHGLRPPALDAFGLAAALDAHVRSVADATGIAVDFGAGAIEGTLSPEAELALYRIVQEALSNVIRHAQATRVRVNLRATADHVVAAVEDDGCGFRVNEMRAATKGFGLFGMRERAEYLGGRLEIRSGPGEGTRIEAVIPRPASSEERPV